MGKSTLACAALLSSLLLTSGCVYKIDIPQGNYVEQKQVDQLRAGMSQEQVEYVLGAPLLVDSFDPQVWNYLYYLRQGKGEVERKLLSLHFSQGKLTKLSGDFKAPQFNQPLYAPPSPCKKPSFEGFCVLRAPRRLLTRFGGLFGPQAAQLLGIRQQRPVDLDPLAAEQGLL